MENSLSLMLMALSHHQLLNISPSVIIFHLKLGNAWTKKATQSELCFFQTASFYILKSLQFYDNDIKWNIIDPENVILF